jgi:Ca-activated chloride channel family protein
VGGESRTFEFPGELAGSDRSTTYDFVERLWVMRRIGFIIDQIDMHGQNKELTDELVALSTKHGILTPYTSFLADERVQLHFHADNAQRAGVELRRLGEVNGPSGTAQRGEKAKLQQALSARESDVDRQRIAAKALGAGAAGRPAAAAGGFGLGAIYKDAEGKDAIAMTVRNVGNKTFFQKGNRWVDSEVTPEDEAKGETIEQFSDRFFELSRNQTAAQNQYFTFEDAITVKIDGKVYRIEAIEK